MELGHYSLARGHATLNYVSKPLCDNCGVNPATVFITKVINQETSHHCYCENCARAKAEGEGWLSQLTAQLGELSQQPHETPDSSREPLSQVPMDELLASLLDGVESNEDIEASFLSDEELGHRPETPAVPPMVEQVQDDSPRCPTCGTSWDQLKTDGRAGCSGCYNAFRSQLDEVMMRMQRGAQHVGKTPRAAEKRRLRLEHLRQRRDHQLEMLQKRLKDAVEREDYEEAAQIRDKIKIISSTIVSD